MATPSASVPSYTYVTPKPGQTLSIWMQSGQHYKVRKPGTPVDGATPQVADNVIASRHGNSLHLRYADGSMLNFDNFYIACQDASACSVNLASNSILGTTLSAETAAGPATAADGGTLVYAHGSQDLLMSMAQGQSSLMATLTEMASQPATPYASQAATAMARGAAAAEGSSTGLLAVLGGLALAGGGGGGGGGGGSGGSSGATAPAAPTATAITGTIFAGPIAPGNDLEVTVFAADGTTILAEHVAVDTNGTFTANVGSYVGVVIAKLVNKGSGADFIDEATDAAKNMNAELMVAGVILTPGAPITLNMNPLTTIAAKKLGSSPTAAQVNATNDAVAAAFGLTGLQTTTVVPTNGGSYNAADGVSNAEKYGAVLAALSGMDKLNGGDMQATIDQLVAKISVTGTTATLDDTAKYAISAGAKTAATASGAPTGLSDAVAGTIQIDATATALNGLALITAYAGSSNASAPGVFDYANANITGIDSVAKLQLVNEIIKSKTTAEVDTAAEVQALADAVSAVVAAAAGGTAPTLAQLNTLGITGATAENLAVIDAAIAATADDGTGVDTVAELQALVSAKAAAFTAALVAISAAADANNASATGPALSAYTDAGVTGVTSANLAAINSALNSTSVIGISVDTTAEIQTLVNAYNTLLAGADGTANSNATATAAQYAAIGISGATTASVSLLNTVIDKLANSAVDTVAEVQELATAAAAVITNAAGGNAATLLQLQALGITGVASGNLAAVQQAIAATADDGSAVDTVAELQTVVTAAAVTANALNTISAAADANNASATAPALSAYTDAGVTGVTSANLAAINSALNSASVIGTSVDTTAEIQTLVNAYNTVMAGADGTANSNATATAAQYAAIGISGATTASVSLLDTVIDKLASSAVDTVAKVQELATAAAAVITNAAGGTATTLLQLQALGIAGVTSGNLADVQQAIAATADDGSAVDTVTELQNVVSVAVAAAAAAAANPVPNALATISAAADANTASATAPALSVYTNAGVTGVTSANVASISSALNSANVIGTSVDTTAEVQTLVNAYNAILTGADGTANNNVTATAAQYSSIGINGATTASASLLDTVIDSLTVAAVDTVAEVQELATAAAAVMTNAAGGAATTLLQLQALGITGVTNNNLAAVQQAIAATADDGSAVDTVTELQAVVSAAVSAAAAAAATAITVAALSSISAAASANNASTLTTGVYSNAGVTGVTSANLAAINSALDSAAITGTNADTTAEIQLIVDAYAAILARSNRPTQAQYAQIGVTGVDSATKLNLLDDAVLASSSSQLASEPHVQALADAAAAVVGAPGGGTAPTLSQLTTLGVTGVTADNLAVVQAAIHNTATNGTGVDTLAEVQGLVNSINTAVNSISLYASAGFGSSGGTPPTTQTYTFASVTGVTANNLNAINSALASDAVGYTDADTTAKIQAIVDAYNTILAGADGTANSNATATAAQYARIGVTGVDTVEKLSLLNDVVDRKARTGVDTEAEVQAVADGVAAVIGSANQGSSPMLGHLQSLDIQYATYRNIAAIANDFYTLNLTASDLDTVAKVQAIVTTAATNFGGAARGVIGAAADANAGDPTLNNYSDAGVNGVTADNLAAINSALHSASVTSASLNTSGTPEKIQTLVNSYNAILAEANGATADATPGVNPTASDYGRIGVTLGLALFTPANLALLNDILGAQTAAQVSTFGDLDNLARIANAIQLTASGGTPGTALTGADFSLIGITGITSGNISGMLAAIAAQADNGSGTDTLAKLQALSQPNTAPPAPIITVAAVDNKINADEQSGSGSTLASAYAAANHAVVVTGTGEVGDTVSLALQNGSPLVSTAIVQSNGTWSISLSHGDVTTITGLGEGAQSLLATQTNLWGNATTSVVHIVTVDTVAPGTPGISGTSAGGDAIVNAAEYANGITITGTGDAGDTILLRYGGGSQTLSSSIVVDGSGAWSYFASHDDLANIVLHTTNNGTVSNPVGSDALTAKQYDAAGNSGGTALLSLTIDTSPANSPGINSYTALLAAALTNGYTVSGNGASGNTVQLSLGGYDFNGGSATIVSGGWTITVSAADVAALLTAHNLQGSQTLLATATNATGNTSVSDTNSAKTITVDTIPPALTVNHVATDDVINYSESLAPPEISGTGVAGNGITVDFSGVNHPTSWFSGTTTVANDGTWHLALANSDFANFGQGNQTVTVTEHEPSGNDTTVTLNFSVHTQLPIAQTATFSDNLINAAEKAAGVDISGTGTANDVLNLSIQSGATVTSLGTVTVQSDLSWQTHLDTSTLLDGNYSLFVTKTDSYGNASPANPVSFRVDTTAPTASCSGANIQSTEVGTAYLVDPTLLGASPTLADIVAVLSNTARAGSIQIFNASTDTPLSSLTLLAHSAYDLYTADQAGNLSAVVHNIVI